jgi:hypothetical protein
MKDIIAEDKKWFCQVYNSEPVVFESGEGIYERLTREDIPRFLGSIFDL